MTLQTLPFCPQPGIGVENEPRRKVLKFGDGYEQRAPDGLNPLQKKFSVAFNLRHAQAVTLTQFFADHGGVKAFMFQSRKVVCPKWSETIGKTHTKINCEFEEVVTSDGLPPTSNNQGATISDADIPDMVAIFNRVMKS